MATTAQQWDEVLNFIHALSLIDNLDEFGGRVLGELDGLIPSDLASWNEVDPLGGRAEAISRPRSPTPAEMDAWSRWSHQHPPLMRSLETGDGSARRLSDFLSSDELHRLELYTDLYGPMGVEYQLAVGLPAPQPIVLGIALNRGDHDFSDDEVDLLNLLRPHLVQAYRRVRLLAERSQALDSIAAALQDEGRAFHVMGEPLAPPVANLLSSYFGTARGALPPAVQAWVDEERGAFESASPERIRQPLVAHCGRRRLTVRFIPGGKGPDLLWLDERLAEELGLSVPTVENHLERIYRKVGVSNRTGAVAQAFDALTVVPPEKESNGGR
jgi:hypothetical protein